MKAKPQSCLGRPWPLRLRQTSERAAQTQFVLSAHLQGGDLLERTLAGAEQLSISFGAPVRRMTEGKSTLMDPEDPVLLQTFGNMLDDHLGRCVLRLSGLGHVSCVTHSHHMIAWTCIASIARVAVLLYPMCCYTPWDSKRSCVLSSISMPSSSGYRILPALYCMGGFQPGCSGRRILQVGRLMCADTSRRYLRVPSLTLMIFTVFARRTLSHAAGVSQEDDHRYHSRQGL